jgi:ribosomal-protein-alanine N-acetyltransferase
MTGYHIEPLTSPVDLEAVMEVEHASFTNPWTRDMYLSDLANENVSHMLIARDDAGRVIGFCAFWHVTDEVHINNLAVAPPFRRGGVASALLSRVFGDAAHLGATRVTLEVRRSNEAAQRLYERFGFDVAGVRVDYYSHPTEDALVLCLDLPGRS